VDELCPDMPDEGNIGKHIVLKPTREAIKTLAESWTGRISEARRVSSRPGLQSWPRRLKN
jgi:hypothetical protein